MWKVIDIRFRYLVGRLNRIERLIMATVAQVQASFDAFKAVVSDELGQIDSRLDALIARVEALIADSGGSDSTGLDALKSEIESLQSDVQTKADAIEAKADAERP